MRGFIKKAMGRTSNPERGFTLIELLVVIGIIVALAAITVPLVTKFAGKGDEGASHARGYPAVPPGAGHHRPEGGAPRTGGDGGV